MQALCLTARRACSPPASSERPFRRAGCVSSDLGALYSALCFIRRAVNWVRLLRRNQNYGVLLQELSSRRRPGSGILVVEFWCSGSGALSDHPCGTRPGDPQQRTASLRPRAQECSGATARPSSEPGRVPPLARDAPDVRAHLVEQHLLQLVLEPQVLEPVVPHQPRLRAAELPRRREHRHARVRRLHLGVPAVVQPLRVLLLVDLRFAKTLFRSNKTETLVLKRV